MSESKRTMPKRRIVSLLAVAVLLTVILLPAANASAAERLTKPEEIDGVWVDGVAADIHNSYIWCGAVFTQDDGNDYLWVGTNRDFGAGQAKVAGIDEDMYEAIGLPAPSPDTAAKIYRCNLNDPDAEWELMWSTDPFSGYRKMIVFNDELYVFVGTSVRAKGAYAAVYRFSSDFGLDDGPTVPDAVMWSRLPAGVNYYYRSATISEDGNTLYVGTFDGKIYSTDGSGLSPYDTSTMPPLNSWTVGWTLLGTIDGLFTPVPGDDNRVWDLIEFNGFLYTIVTSEYGFMLFKYDLANDIWTQIVGWEPGAKYPAGLGIKKHATASPFLASFDGTDYVYISTLAVGQYFVRGLGEALADVSNLSENVAEAFDYYCPAAIYRFDADDRWEVVVGDKNGGNVAYDSYGYKVPNIGNLNAGFSPSVDSFIPGLDVFLNMSSNQYVWWMAQDANGRLWASTWDPGVFRDMFNEHSEYIPMVQLGIIVTNDVIADILALVPGAAFEVGKIRTDSSALVEQAAAAAVLLAAEMADAIRGGSVTDMRLIVQQLLITVAAMMTDTADAMRTLLLLSTVLASEVNDILSAPGAADSLSRMTETLMNFTLFINDTSNPAGFDLFYTDDGKNWKPYTVNGLGDPQNYGGRVLLPYDDGIFVLTTNPFTGCQAWFVNDDSYTPSLTMDAPASVELEVGESVTFLAQSFGVSPDLSVSVNNTAFRVEYKIVEVDPTIYTSTVVRAPGLTLGGFQWVELGGYEYVYEITLTAVGEFDGKLRVTIGSDMQVTYGVIDAKVTKAADDTGGGGSGGGGTKDRETGSDDTANGGNGMLIAIAVIAVIAVVGGAAAFMVLRKP